MNKLLAGFFVAAVLVGMLAVSIARNAPSDSSPREALQKFKDGCEQQYGVNSQQSVDCFFALAGRYGRENTRDEYKRIYDRAR